MLCVQSGRECHTEEREQSQLHNKEMSQGVNAQAPALHTISHPEEILPNGQLGMNPSEEPALEGVGKSLAVQHISESLIGPCTS